MLNKRGQVDVSYENGEKKKSPILVAVIVLLLIGALAFGAYFLFNKTSQTENGSLEQGFKKLGISNIKTEGSITFNKTSVSLNNVLVEDNTFSIGETYILYFSGITGFEEFNPYGAPAKFVDIAASMEVKSDKGKVILNEPNLFSLYIGGVPAKDASYLSFKLTLPQEMDKGKYSWKVVVSDKKNELNKLIAVVNFNI